MTRATIFRFTVALLLLRDGNASAYWHVLPKKFKRYRLWGATHSQRVTARIIGEHMAAWFLDAFRRSTAITQTMRGTGEFTLISGREFRLPFRVVA